MSALASTPCDLFDAAAAAATGISMLVAMTAVLTAMAMTRDIRERMALSNPE
jgi:hypothetical protein